MSKTQPKEYLEDLAQALIAAKALNDSLPLEGGNVSMDLPHIVVGTIPERHRDQCLRGGMLKKEWGQAKGIVLEICHRALNEHRGIQRPWAIAQVQIIADFVNTHTVHKSSAEERLTQRLESLPKPRSVISGAAAQESWEKKQWSMEPDAPADSPRAAIAARKTRKPREKPGQQHLFRDDDLSPSR